MSTIESLDHSVERITRWIQSQTPIAVPQLNAPASEADITCLGQAIGLKPPRPLADLLRFWNGPDWHGLFPTGEGLMSCARIERVYSRNLEIARQNEDLDWWRTEWIPFAECYEGHEGFLIDAGHPAHPILKYTEADYPRPYAPSMAWLLHALADALHGTQNDPELSFAGRSASMVDGLICWS
ncbi:SMI1/KNR4 family protein [Streptomyces sp. NPDC059255]|uniref:SMI1/KNR4 family protein n=1 Tax=Streptomyces sp. NPDC059255 TaxID=3346793 RepID=UPI0036CAE5C7